MKPLRFLISIGAQLPADSGHSLRLHRAGSPREVAEHGAALWIASEDDLLLMGDGAVIIGRLFSCGERQRLAQLPRAARECRSPQQLAGWLTRETWGGWFALLSDPASGGRYVCRDPAWQLSVYRRAVGDRIQFASEIALFGEAGPPRPVVSWRQLAAHLCVPAMRQPATCLAGIDEVVPAVLAPLADLERPPTRLWDPWLFASSKRSHSGGEAAMALRSTILDCVAAWASQAQRVAVAASGGLDSSIICAALAQTGVPFDCVTIATPDPSGDESAYVEHLAGALGVRAVRKVFDIRRIDITQSASAGLPWPVRKAFMQELARAMREGAEELGADLVFDGNGGDNVFSFQHSANPIVDRLWCERLTSGVLTTFLDMCRLTECDIATMLRGVLRCLIRTSPQPWSADDRLLNLELKASPLPEPLTPWPLQSRCAPGKAAHIGLIQRAQNFTRDLVPPGGTIQFSPLMSQPIIEFCLSIPSWEWCRGGINRSLAREAFRGDLPQATLRRISKAGPDSLSRQVLRQNRTTIRDMLLGGLLAQNRVIDAATVESAIAIDEQADDDIIYRLLDLVEAEAWARSWTG